MSDSSTPLLSLGMSLMLPSNISTPGSGFQPSSALPDVHIVTPDAQLASPFSDASELSSSLASQLARNGNEVSASSSGRNTIDDLATAIASLTKEQDLLLSTHGGNTLAASQVTSLSSSVSNPVPPPRPFSPGSVPPPVMTYTKVYTAQDPSFQPKFWPKVTIHKEIYTLSAQGFRPLLTLFTNHTLRQILNQASMFMKKMTVTGGSSARLLDPDSFGSEFNLSLFLWKEAWENHLVFLEVICDDAIFKWWSTHFLQLLKLPFLEHDFIAILNFDIDQHTRFHACRFNYDKVIYWHQLQHACFKFTRTAPSNYAAGPAFSSGPSCYLGSGSSQEPSSSSSSTCFQPYDIRSTHPSSSCLPSSILGSSGPFSGGRSGKPTPSICLICGNVGHTACDCVAHSSKSGHPLIVRWDRSRGTLTSIKDDCMDFCLPFNLGKGRCNSSHKTCTRNACSLCGGEHNTYSDLCST